ncbi:Lsr2 family protein [Actinoallomurus purpureus]|uniref:Lsr2 family DNA-binding protein n=1 Tax=Actinoallomurus purpureus TaxID=478114 RepID=UPI002092EBEA|nr:histone-like nucleoid-structuring protein Lsr2 [Actinoallomurus purpureus]MCO6008284.1 Lsr2 family protein [Actinoallomurus purpureus]
MTDEVEIPPWERLERLSDMSVLVRDVYAKQWANELMSRRGMDAMPRYIWTAYRDMIAAVLLSLIDDQASASNQRGTRTADRSNSFASQVSDAPGSKYRSDDVPASVIRAWAQQKGISIGDRGRVPAWVVDLYHTEHAQEPQNSPGLWDAEEGNDVPAFDPAIDADTSDSKLQDFLQVLRGESRNG